MRFLKWSLFAVVIFAVAWTVFATLNQAPFQTPVAARILRYQTPPVAVKYYLVVAFFGGLAIGVGIAVYYYITLSARLYKRNKTVKELSKQNRMLEEQVAEKESAAAAQAEEATVQPPEQAPARISDSTPEEAGSGNSDDQEENYPDQEDTPDQPEKTN